MTDFGGRAADSVGLARDEAGQQLRREDKALNILPKPSPAVRGPLDALFPYDTQGWEPVKGGVKPSG